MNPNTMTIDECWDFLLEVLPGPKPSGGFKFSGSTLDSIAGALPPDWVWCVVQWYKRDDVEAWCHRIGDCENDSMEGMKADTELLARARAAVKAWMVVKGSR